MNPKETLTAIILAGGTGTHLQALDANVSKPMIPLFDSPLIEHTMKLLASHGVREVFIAASSNATAMADYLGDGSRYGVRIIYQVENSPLGTAGAVKLAAQSTAGTFLVVSGDTVTDANLSAAITAHKSNRALATVLTATSGEPEEYGVVELQPDGRLRRVVEKPRSSEVFSSDVNAGIYILEPEVLSAIPHFQSCDFAADVFPRMIANGDPVYGFPVEGYWRDVSSILGCMAVHFDALEGLVKLDLQIRTVGVGIWHGERAEISASVEITPPVYIGSGACIRRGAAVGPNAVIGCDAMVEESACVSHSVLGAGSLVGRGANIENCVIGAGCSTGESEEMRGLTVFASAGYQPPSARQPAPAAPHIEVRTPESSSVVNT